MIRTEPVTDIPLRFFRFHLLTQQAARERCLPRSEMQSGRYYHNIKNDAPTPYWSVTSGAIGHVDLTKVWPQMFAKTLRVQKGYRTALFGKCMNSLCGANPQASGALCTGAGGDNGTGKI
jgi:hypothetical protein